VATEPKGGTALAPVTDKGNPSRLESYLREPARFNPGLPIERLKSFKGLSRIDESFGRS